MVYEAVTLLLETGLVWVSGVLFLAIWSPPVLSTFPVNVVVAIPTGLCLDGSLDLALAYAIPKGGWFVFTIGWCTPAFVLALCICLVAKTSGGFSALLAALAAKSIVHTSPKPALALASVLVMAVGGTIVFACRPIAGGTIELAVRGGTSAQVAVREHGSGSRTDS